MKYIFRGHIIFEYNPNKGWNYITQHRISESIPAFDFCRMIPEDYKLLSEFFDIAYRHINGEEVELKDIKVN